MTIAILIILGLIVGSFINALVWRIREQEKLGKKTTPVMKKELSLLHGRSMCPKCRHKLSPIDLIPLFSWIILKGKCRYCSEPISAQYPIIEIITSATFFISYIYWPLNLDFIGIMQFMGWLILVTGLIALTVYDIRWMLLPNRIVYPLIAVGILFAISLLVSGDITFYEVILSILIGGGIFYLLFVISDGNWIGGGDVKLGFLIGLFLSNPYYSFLSIFLASLLGALFITPSMIAGKINSKSKIPFGPFLILAGVIVFFLGKSIIRLYKDKILLS